MRVLLPYCGCGSVDYTGPVYGRFFKTTCRRQMCCEANGGLFYATRDGGLAELSNEPPSADGGRGRTGRTVGCFKPREADPRRRA